MNANKNSIHYQLFTIFDRNRDKDNSNICQYTRSVLMGMFLSLFAVLVGVIVTLVILEPVVSLLAYLITDISFIGFFSSVLFALGDPILLIVGFAAWAVAIIFFLIYLFIETKDYLKEKVTELEHSDNINVQKSISTVNVFSEYVKSKHDKVCRNISFTTGE